ncbi:uncharacterized protein PV09_08811 [Verruconis gallopava]|uniref:Autophagy-related protein 29 n=1 Tax=Verruconis gallopava TaxID=253628 RepID=A0A0D1YFK4_9PEZI|nr:uncharacterized protein PV09_08811 [Verruconis gallopava]KIV99506.1 hypothetical protein PV09_08811 [Verruconis gallopava]
MPPPSEKDAKSVLKAEHRRSASGSSSPLPEESKAAKSTRQALPSPAPPNVHYTLLVKLPFVRGDFEDPPQVEWDAIKDRKLWKIISKNSRSADIDWALHAKEFGVTQTFLLQQAAWLYERHLQHVKAQMTKLRTSNAPTPILGPASQQTAPTGGVPMKRLGSGGASRAPSAMSVQSRDSPVAGVDTGSSGVPQMRPGLSRTPSSATVTQSRPFLPPASPRQPVQRSFRTSAAAKRIKAIVPQSTDEQLSPHDPVSPPPASDSSSKSSSDSDSPPTRQSQLFRRPPAFQRQKKTQLSNVDDVGEESGDDSPTFLPFAAKADSVQPKEDPSATLRDMTPPHLKSQPSASKGQAARAPILKSREKGKQAMGKIESSASSASSAAAPPSSADVNDPRRPDAITPRHRAELARLSPRRQASMRDGSDGTPSMGSSFSDLDDTSITQSALEEALASNLRHGGASRLSSISHAFGSRLYGRGQQQG